MLNIVLHEPEIPANTGNIGRTCVATNTRLHLIEPLGFRLNEKALKRAGMDYWADLDVRTYINFEDFLEKNPGAKIYMATTKAPKVYTEVQYEPDCYIMFGKESARIPPLPICCIAVTSGSPFGVFSCFTLRSAWKTSSSDSIPWI
jgi:tRNA (cytidine/uridine-2'-O-)-methyltransferase